MGTRRWEYKHKEDQLWTQKRNNNKTKKYETVNSGQYIICGIVCAGALRGFMQLYRILGGYPYQLI